MFRPIDFIKDNFIAEYPSSTTSYYGFYDPVNVVLTGGAVNTAVEQFLIAKETKDVSGNTTKLQYASKSYNKIWDDRASLTYL